MRRKDSDWASLSSLLTQVKREKRLRVRRHGVMKNARNDERNCPTKDESFKLNEHAFTDSGNTERTCWKLTQDEKCLAGACPCFLSPKKVVRRLKYIPSALLLSSVRYPWFAIAFSGSLSGSFSPASRVHFSKQANKERRSRRFKSCDLDSLVRWRTNDLLPLDRKDTTPS